MSFYKMKRNWSYSLAQGNFFCWAREFSLMRISASFELVLRSFWTCSPYAENLFSACSDFWCASLSLYPIISLFRPLIWDDCRAEKVNAVALATIDRSSKCCCPNPDFPLQLITIWTAQLHWIHGVSLGGFILPQRPKYAHAVDIGSHERSEPEGAAKL